VVKQSAATPKDLQIPGAKVHMKPKNISMSIKHLNYQFAAGMDPKACV
jgi:hypothetical protein